MNVTLENLAPCKKLVRFEEDAVKVDEVFAATEKEFQRRVALPGFRPGKAPLPIVLKQYEKDIEEEAKRRLINSCFEEGMKQQKLTAVNRPEIEEIQFGRGQSLQFAATVETAPEFEVPEYRGLPAKRATGTVTDADVDGAVEALRVQAATFEKLERPVEQGDIAVVNFTGTSEGQPITAHAPSAQGLTKQENFWVEVKQDSFIPGFSEQLIGATAGERRTVNVDFLADFPTKELAGKKGVYEVELVEIKKRVLPELTDKFAITYGAEDVGKLREGVRADLQNERNLQLRKRVRGQVVRALMDRVNFDLPESYVQHETRNIVYDIVSRNQQRGISKDVIEKEKEEIYSAANQTARERVKAMYLFNRIAEKEGIRVAREELHTRILALAQSYKMAPDKFLKELEKGAGVGEIQQQILTEKVIDFLQENARIEDAV